MSKIFYQFIIWAALLSLMAACQEDYDGRLYITSEQMQISDYLSNRDDMTVMTSLLNRAGQFHLLNSYGHYTVFAPTDAAWSEYFRSIGKSGIDDLTDQECTDLFQFHVLFSGVNLKAQKTGLLNAIDTTMNGIQHYVDLTKGINDIVVNKASQVEGISELPNGFVYTVSSVFTPRPSNIYQYLKTGGYSLFSQAVDAVGMKDTLQNLNVRYYSGVRTYYNPIFTLFAEPDEVFRKAGITTLEQLESAIAAKAGPGNTLKDFVRYHIIRSYSTMDYGYVRSSSILSVTDTRRLSISMYQAENISTLACNQKMPIAVSASGMVSPDPVLNDQVKLNLLRSDVSFRNGIVHELDGILYPENKAAPIELVYECENTFKYIPSPLNEEYFQMRAFDIAYDTLRSGIGAESNVSYSSSFYNANSTGYALVLANTEKGGWIDFYIRNLPAGDYDILLNYRRVKKTTSQKTNVYFRKASEEYNWRTQLKYSGLDMSYDDASAEEDKFGVYPEFNQNFRLDSVRIKEYGDYVIRFVHTDNREGRYDNIILKPIN